MCAVAVRLGVMKTRERFSEKLLNHFFSKRIYLSVLRVCIAQGSVNLLKNHSKVKVKFEESRRRLSQVESFIF